MDESTTDSKQALIKLLENAGVDSGGAWFDCLINGIRATEATLVGPVSPEESPIVTVDLLREHVDWISRNVTLRWEGRDRQSLWIDEREIFVIETLWSRKMAYVIVQDVKDGFICWIWQLGRDGVLRVFSPHLEPVALTLEKEAVRLASRRRGERVPG